MPILTKNHLALKFQQNWLEKHPNDVPAASKDGGLDDSLTSLNWLHNLNIMNIGTPTPPASPQPPSENSGDFKVNPNQILNVGYVQPPKIDPKFAIGDLPATMPSPLDKINYKTNPYVKPPYSYATLICMAMKESKKSKITLSSIYNWITDNFMYYRLADPSWQNSIRHNLSLNKCFQKVPRRKDEPGKGGFWRINPEYSDMFVNGIIKKRRGSSLQEGSSVTMTPPKRPHDKDSDFDEPSKKVKVERVNGAEDDVLLNGDVSWDSLLNQDIIVNGVKIKTEQIIDEEDMYGVASPVMAMSPPSSDTNSDDIDDIFGTDFGSETSELGKENEALDLTVQGVKIEPPDWWTDSMNTAALREFMSSPHHPSSGLSTPIAPSPIRDLDSVHPWATNRTDIDDAIAAFDLDNLFDMANIPSPLGL